MEEGQGEFGGAYIRRVAAGDPAVYLPKEALWPHIRECALNTLDLCLLSVPCGDPSSVLVGGALAVCPRVRCRSFLLAVSVLCRRLPAEGGNTAASP
jgi:hypothetical protein